MLTREKYKPKTKIDELLNNQNQPSVNYSYYSFTKTNELSNLLFSYTNNFANDSSNKKENLKKMIIEYPNMMEAYDAFSTFSLIPKENFILTNGCEEALKIVLQVIKRIEENKDITLLAEYPRWQMVDVISDQILYKNPKDINYILNKDKDSMMSFSNYDIDSLKSEIEYIGNNDVCVLYNTLSINNMLIHKKWNSNLFMKNCKCKLYDIIDETYTPFKTDIKDTKLSKLEKDNIFIIGSFSKAIGCGLRLGYILFNQKYEKYFNLYRPQYISPLAISFLTKSTDAIKTLKSIDFTNFVNSIFDNYSEKGFDEYFSNMLIGPYLNSISKFVYKTMWYSTFYIDKNLLPKDGRCNELMKFSKLNYALDKDIILARRNYSINDLVNARQRLKQL